MRWEEHGIVIVDDRQRVNLDVVQQLLHDAYWAKGRSREAIAITIEHSLCFVVLKDDRQIGFARIISDLAVFSWIADVIIAPHFRGQGLGKFLMRCIMAHPALQGTHLGLRTNDAHGLYEQFGFVRSEFMVCDASTPQPDADGK